MKFGDLISQRVPYKPYFYYEKVWGSSPVKAYFAEFLKSLGDRIVVDDLDGISAHAVTQLQWDTEKINIKCGRIDLLIGDTDHKLRIAASNAVEAATSQGIKHLTIRVNAHEIDKVCVLENIGFNLVDGILTFSRTAVPEVTVIVPNTEYLIRKAMEPDIPQIRQIASSIYRYDRFHADPAISADNADALHADWLENSVRKVAADHVLVAELNGKILGFTTCKIDAVSRSHFPSTVGTIVLVGVTPEYQGHGIAKTLSLAATKWFFEHGIGVVEVGTQVRNIAASRTYIGCGFGFVNSSLTLRRIS